MLSKIVLTFKRYKIVQNLKGVIVLSNPIMLCRALYFPGFEGTIYCTYFTIFRSI